MDAELLRIIANMGFPAAMAVVLFWAYERQTRELRELVRANTAAMERLAMTVERLARALERAGLEVDRDA